MTAPKRYLIFALALILFFGFLCVGFHLAQRKPIWNDEILSQTAAVDKLSYGQIMLGDLKGEGNNHPLYYLLQKFICDLNQYKFPKEWEGEYLFSHPRSQKVMRIGSNIFMSASLALLFLFFAFRHGLWAGFYGIGVALLSVMTWIYWVEARPYSLWFLLSVLQAVLLLMAFEEKRLSVRLLPALAAVHVLLGFTTMASALQILVVSLAVFILLKERRVAAYFWSTVLPLIVCLFYYLQSSRFALNMPLSWEGLLTPHLPVDRAVFFVIYIGLLFFYARIAKRPVSAQARNYLVFLCMLLAATLVYFLFKYMVNVRDPHDMIKDRYFLYVTPAIIIAVTLFSVDMVRVYRRDPWMLFNVILGLSGFTVIRFLRLYAELAHANLTLNFLGEYW